MTGTLSTPRWTGPTSAGNVSSLARSPVAPKITSASTRFVVISAPCLIAPSPLRARPRRGAPPDTGDPASGQAGDALADEQDAEDEEEHQHDRGVIARQPGPPALRDARRLRAHREVGNERRRHRDAAKHYEDRQRGRLLAARQPGLRDRDGRGDGQDKVLGIEAGDCSPGPGRLRHCFAARSRKQTPSASLIAYAAVDGPLLLDTPAALAMTRTTPPTTTSPSTQPATNAPPLLRALGVMRIRMIAMTGRTPMTTPSASGKMPPMACPIRMASFLGQFPWPTGGPPTGVASGG